MVQDEFVKALLDKYTAAELVELIDIDTELVIDAFWELIWANYEELLEQLNYGTSGRS